MQLNSAITTANSAADGRLKVDVGRKKKKKRLLKQLVKKCNGRGGPGIKTVINNENVPGSFRGFNVNSTGLHKSGTLLTEIMRRIKDMEKKDTKKFLKSFRNMNISGPQLGNYRKTKKVDMIKR